MKLISSLIYILVFTILNLFVGAAKHEIKENVTLSQHPVLILVSFDGFRYNYFDRPDNVGTPNLNRLKQLGSYVPYMTNQFVTKTFPNHMSIATGLYVESHGVVDNWFFDPTLNKTLNSTNEELWNYDNKTLPLWTINELEGNGRRSGVMMWPGSEHEYGIKNTVPSRVEKWNLTVPFEDRVDQVILWITNKTDPVNLVFLYFEEPDEVAHGFGPKSPEVTEQIVRVDNITGYLIEQLEKRHIFNRVNLMLMSDHGFEEVQQTHIINITAMVDPSFYDRYGTSPMLQLKPKDGKLEQVYAAFKKGSVGNNFQVYKKDDIPSRWHYTNNRRIMPIILVADLGYVFDDFYQTMNYYNSKYNRTANFSNVYGAHGYDNVQLPMHPFFVAHGPLFRSGYEAPPFENIDLFPLVCKILNISNTPPHNGSISHVDNILARKGFSITSPVGWVFGAALIVGLTILLGIMSLMVSKKKNHQPLLSEGGYRFINNQDFRGSSDSLDIQIESQQLNGHGVQIIPSKEEEYQALLMSSSTEEL